MSRSRSYGHYGYFGCVEFCVCIIHHQTDAVLILGYGPYRMDSETEGVKYAQIFPPRKRRLLIHNTETSAEAFTNAPDQSPSNESTPSPFLNPL